MKVLITGTTSGLGKYLAENIPCDEHNRNDDHPDERYDVVINCAYDHGSYERPYRYDYNISLIESILCIPATHFIQMSTIDVYAPEKTEYAQTKLEIERLIRSSRDGYYIMRLGMLVGKYMGRNNLIKMFAGEEMSLSPDSTVCLISYDDVLEFITRNLDQSWRHGIKPGTGNLGSKRLTLQEIADYFDITPKWGDYTYKSADIGNKQDFMDWEIIDEVIGEDT